MRLRLAPVEYKVCATADCGGTYEGERCPHCHAAFDPTRGRKELADRLILVAVDPAMYEQTHRCRCPVCKNLFGLREENVIVRAQCHHCAQPLFSRTQLRMLWKDMEEVCIRSGNPSTRREKIPINTILRSVKNLILRSDTVNIIKNNTNYIFIFNT